MQVERVFRCAVPRQVARLQESLIKDGSSIKAIAGVGAPVVRQLSWRREGLAADGALDNELAPFPALPLLGLLARSSRCLLFFSLLP